MKKTILITGATSGIGLEAGKILISQGHTILAAGKDFKKIENTINMLRLHAHNGGEAEFYLMDLSDLNSVSTAATRVKNRHSTLDVLINNAGIMALPKRYVTAQGFEAQWGVNYLSHVALTIHLMPLLHQSVAPRVVMLSSLAHRRGYLAMDDLNGEKNYKPFKAYAQSKLACLMYAFELERFAKQNNWNLRSLAVHPGWAATNLVNSGPMSNMRKGWFHHLVDQTFPLIAQPGTRGALPTVYAATSDWAKGGGYYGPNGICEIWGKGVKPARVAPQALDLCASKFLWNKTLESLNMKI